MRTAVVRVNVDPTGVLTPAQLREGMAALLGLTAEIGADVVENDHGRDVQLLIASDDVHAAKRTAIELCSRAFGAFGTEPAAGAVTFISRGTDDDAHGVLSAFGLAGEITREPGDDGYDVIHVTLREADLEHIPESRIHTALEASLNCEVHIHIR